MEVKINTASFEYNFVNWSRLECHLHWLQNLRLGLLRPIMAGWAAVWMIRSISELYFLKICFSPIISYINIMRYKILNLFFNFSSAILYHHHPQKNVFSYCYPSQVWDLPLGAKNVTAALPIKPFDPVINTVFTKEFLLIHFYY